MNANEISVTQRLDHMRYDFQDENCKKKQTKMVVGNDHKVGE